MKVHQLRRSIFIVGVFIVLGCLQLAFFYTYPLNIGYYDSYNYLQIMYTGDSHLIHATGYPFILSGILGLLNWAPQADYLTNLHWLRQLQETQLGIHLLISLGIYLLVHKIFGFWVSLVALILVGTNLSLMANVNSASPEWLQGDLAILSFLLLIQARNFVSLKKLILILFSALVFAAAYLVKYNTLLVAPAFIGILLFGYGQKKLVNGIGLCILFITTCGILIFTFANTLHFKTTGTKQLSYDHAWVLTASLPRDYFLYNPNELGINALRFIALVKSTPKPPPNDLTFTFDMGPNAEVRTIYQKQYQEIFDLTRQELIHYISDRPFPEKFTAFNSSIPLYYFYGLPITDNLGINVFIEALSDYPLVFLKRSYESIKGLLITPPPTQYYPLFSNIKGFVFEGNQPISGWISLKYNDQRYPQFAMYFNPSRKVYFYGVQFFDFLNQPFVNGLVTFLYPCLNLVALIGIFIVRQRQTRIYYYSIFLGVTCFIFCTTLLLDVRPKEAVFITPLYSLCIAIAVVALIASIHNKSMRFKQIVRNN